MIPETDARCGLRPCVCEGWVLMPGNAPFDLLAGTSPMRVLLMARDTRLPGRMEPGKRDTRGHER